VDAAGVSLAAIHGRSRTQRYRRPADWEYIREVVQEANLKARGIPVIGNGDIFSYSDYERAKQVCSHGTVMVARGALIKPWVFKEIKERKHWDISSHERFEMLKTFVRFGLEHWGTDQKGVDTTRRFLLEWLSFLHRYVPIGLLEVIPASINQRPPQYVGRDDMETLMGSSNCKDWVRISEMLLGPVPANFVFMPKHRASAYASTDEDIRAQVQSLQQVVATADT